VRVDQGFQVEHEMLAGVGRDRPRAGPRQFLQRVDGGGDALRLLPHEPECLRGSGVVGREVSQSEDRRQRVADMVGERDGRFLEHVVPGRGAGQLLHAAALDRKEHRAPQQLYADLAFDEIVLRPALDRLGADRLIGQAGQDHDGRLGHGGAEMLQSGQAGRVGQA